jgi:RNA polymerase sigma-70 factor (ECF subfamily)
MSRFDTTRWSLVLRAQGSGGHARPALETLCRMYRPPVLAYIRGRGYPRDAAEDLTQSFFARFLERNGRVEADPARGRFRAFLLTAIKRFLINAGDESRAAKRGGHIQFESFDADADRADTCAGDGGPERAFERAWAMVVVDAAMLRLAEEAQLAEKRELFDQLRGFLTETPDDADYARVAAVTGLRRNTVAVAVHRLRHRLRELVRDELAQTTADRAALDVELHELRAALSGASIADGG